MRRFAIEYTILLPSLFALSCPLYIHFNFKICNTRVHGSLSAITYWKYKKNTSVEHSMVLNIQT